jgi:hypothetical protein
MMFIKTGKIKILYMDGIEMILRIKEIIGFVKVGDKDRAILYLKYMIEDIEMYKNNSL